MKAHIPNLLGVFRILTTPLLVVFILAGTPAGYIAAFVLLILMAVSDVLDGKLARSMGVVSPLGIFLDTTSDKIFVTAALIPMVEQNLLWGWVAITIIVRDFIVSGLRSYAAAEGVVISARAWGKQKLVLTVVAICWALLAAAAHEIAGTPGFVLTFLDLWWVVMAFALIWTVGSGLEYLWNARGLLLAPPSIEKKAAPTPRTARRPSLNALRAIRRRERSPRKSA